VVVLSLTKIWLKSIRYPVAVTCQRSHYVKTWCHPQNRNYAKYCNAIREEPSHSLSKYTYINLVKFGHMVFNICERTDKQIDRHAPHNTLQCGKVIAIITSSHSMYHIMQFQKPMLLREMLNFSPPTNRNLCAIWMSFQTHYLHPVSSGAEFGVNLFICYSYVNAHNNGYMCV